jgi:methionyl-tRNA formyltransferase
MDQGMDTGPILAQASSPIGPQETAGELELRLAEVSASLLVDNLPAWSDDRLSPRPQPSEGATIAPRLRKGSGRLDFGKAAAALERQIRAYNPWPGSFFIVETMRVAVLRATVVPAAGGEPGVFEVQSGYPVVATADGALRLELVQPAGRRTMTGAEFLRGAPQLTGLRLPPAART